MRVPGGRLLPMPPSPGGSILPPGATLQRTRAILQPFSPPGGCGIDSPGRARTSQNHAPTRFANRGLERGPAAISCASRSITSNRGVCGWSLTVINEPPNLRNTSLVLMACRSPSRSCALLLHVRAELWSPQLKLRVSPGRSYCLPARPPRAWLPMRLPNGLPRPGLPAREMRHPSGAARPGFHSSDGPSASTLPILDALCAQRRNRSSSIEQAAQIVLGLLSQAW